MVWLEKIRDKDWDDTGGNGSDCKEDWSLQLIGQGFTMEREKEGKKEREKKRETEREEERD